MNFSKRFAVKPGKRVKLDDYDPDDTAGADKKEVKENLEKYSEKLADWQHKLYAENMRAVLLILQGMDTSGKDGTISHVMSRVNPQGCRVTSFKQPTPIELSHDFLWRVHQAVPARGEIGIFNRSHYEEVLVVRVHGLVPKEVWSRRYDQINDFERILVDSGVTVLKFFLHISKKEQLERLQARLDDPTKLWKFNPGDLQERKLWKDYMAAYEDALSRCSTKDSPWFIIPANKKWVRNLAVSQILLETFERLNPQFPRPRINPKTIKL
jgi:PPK2 family polyphosphate:nucleotide phosphotransferase